MVFRPEKISKIEAAETHEQLKKTLEEESIGLREKGFEVDNECRVKSEAFNRFFPAEIIKRDLERVKESETWFQKKTSPETAEKEKRGEALEMAKTIGFNRHWFGNRLISVRTSKYDDFFNGVDNLIIDTKTGEPLAAVDTAVNYLIKAKQLIGKIQSGCAVKYGFGLTPEGVTKTSYKNLPLFIISLGQAEMDQIASGDFKDVEKNLLSSLQRQGHDFSDPEFPAAPEVKSSYQRVGAIFNELKSEK